MIFSYGSTSRMYHSRVTRMPRSVDAIICVDGCLAARDHDVHGRFADFVWHRKTVAGWLGPARWPPAGNTRSRAPRRSSTSASSAPRNALTIEWRAGLQRMVRIVVNRDVLAEQLPADAVAQKAAAVADGGGAEVAEHLAHQVQHRGRLQDHCVASGRQFDGRARSRRLVCGRPGQGRADPGPRESRRCPWPSLSCPPPWP